MSPKQSGKKRNNKKTGSNSNLKKKITSPTESSESIVTSSVQSNSVENVQNLDIDNNLLNPNSLINLSKLSNMSLNDKVGSYDVTTTYKTEIVESSVDPETGDIIEVITEVFITDTMTLNKQEDYFGSISNSTQDLALEEVLEQLNMGTEICKELLG